MSLPAFEPDSPAPTAVGADRNDMLRRLMGPAARGDVAAFEALYNATARWMLVRVRRIVGPSLAEDVLSDVYLQVWRRLDSFDAERGEPLAWLMAIARSRALDRLRSERTSHGGAAFASAGGGAVEQSHSDGPEELLALAQSWASLHACLSRLSAKEQAVLAFAYFQDYTHAEIAALTGIPLGSVKTLITRSQQKLRKALGLGPAAPRTKVRQRAPAGLTMVP